MDHEPITRPSFSAEEALEIAENRFGVPVSTARELPSDRDQNYLLHHQESDRKYVLKLSQSEEDPQVLDLQNRMLEHLARAGFRLSQVLFTPEGEEIAEVPASEGSSFLARLLTWVPGIPLYRVSPQGPALLESLGAFLGGMDKTLEDFAHPAQDRYFRWDLRGAEEVIQANMGYLKDPERRDLLHRMSKRFLQRLSPVESELRVSVIHGDANDHNVLVTELQEGADPGQRTVSGILDFGDAIRSYTVGDVSIAAAYLMLGKGDPFSAAAQVVRGYNRVFPLREGEIAALLPLMGLRLSISVAIAAHQQSREPDNEYLTVTEGPAWQLLERLDREILDLPHLMFREACGQEPVSNARRITDWLKENGPASAPVVGEPLSVEGNDEAIGAEPIRLDRASLHIFDLQGDSIEFPRQPDTEDAGAWTRLLFGAMAEAGAKVGVGRYDEVRGWYTADAFRAAGFEPPEWRTVHLGVDLFLAPGAPVLAPFDAIVHSVAINEGNLDYGPTVILEHRTQEGMKETARFWTLYGHLAKEEVSDLLVGRPLQKGTAFARIGDFPVNGNWAPHLHFQVITDLLGLEGNFPGVALPSQRGLWKALSPDPNLILGIPDRAREQEDGVGIRDLAPGPAEPGNPSGATLYGVGLRSREEILEARSACLGPTLSIAYQRPLKIVRGSGQFLYDDEGQAYLDCVNNVPHVGHNHPRVVEAGQKQMALLNTNTRYLHDLLVDYAERLVATLPDPLSVVYFVCTGSEANELALRLARTHTGREDVVVVDGAYHGNTSALVDLSPYKFDRPGGEGAKPWVHKTPMPDPYRGRFRASLEGAEEVGGGVDYLPLEELGLRYGGQVREVLEGMMANGRKPAAFFCESLLGCGGQIIPPPGYMADAFQHVRDVGGVCVADEVQVGFGRVGSHFWAFETQGVVPDIVTLGKPMANGHPMGAVVTTPEIAKSFTTGMEYFNTFGGNPVSCAIGMAVLDVIREDGLQENALRVGSYLLERLRELQARFPLVGEVRGLGLFIGVELVEGGTARVPAAGKAARVKERLRDHRILLSTDGPDDNVLKIKPPLVFTKENADRLVTVLGRILDEDGIRI